MEYPTSRDLISRCEYWARQPLTYQFGASNPNSGALDCSATVQVVLKDLGLKSIPRTSYAQYQWLEKQRSLRKVRRYTSPESIEKRLRPGQLLFWGGTYESKNPVTHVMIYLGKDKNGVHYQFGARGKAKKGIHGNGVDVFVLNLPTKGSKNSFVGFGDIPGLRYVY